MFKKGCLASFGTYEEKLENVGQTSLVDKRTRWYLIQTFQIIHQFDNIPVGTFFKWAEQIPIMPQDKQQQS